MLGGLGESLGALPRGAATCDDAAPSGAHASSTADHARILAADYGGDMTDKSLLAVEDIPAVAAVGFGGLELGFVVGLDFFGSCKETGSHSLPLRWVLLPL